MYQLLVASSPTWTKTVLNDFDRFLVDHASAEKKASSMAMTMISHYPDRHKLVAAMTELAVEELAHFREVVKIIQSRGLQLAPDNKDLYVIQFRKAMRQGSEHFLMDRLIVASIIEARGAERFELIAKGLTDGSLKEFYQQIAASEKNHYQLFIELAYHYFPQDCVDSRVEQLLQIEADIIQSIPLRAALH